MNISDLYHISWTVSVAYLMLLTILSTLLFKLVKERSFLFYSLYSFTLLIYLFFYHEQFAFFWDSILKTDVTRAYFRNFNRFSQIVFYTFYILFILQFLLKEHRQKSKLFTFITVQLIALTLLYLFQNFQMQSKLFESVFSYYFLPVMIIVNILVIALAVKKKSPLTNIIASGCAVYCIGAILAIYFYPQSDRLIFDPIVFFFIAVIIENILFAIAIALKYHYKSVENLQLAFRNEQSKINGLFEGSRQERERIARELHDGVAATLATSLIQLECAQTIHPNLKENVHFQKGIQLLENSSDEIRATAHNLMPKTLTHLGFVKAIHELLDYMSNFETSIESEKEQYKINEIQSFILYRMIQEILHNIIKHANATKVSINIEEEHHHLQLQIRDNGIGFEKTNSDGIGLQNLETAAKVLQGNMEINSFPGTGTHVHISIPLQNSLH